MDLLNPRNPTAGSETGIGETPEALPTGRDMKEMALLSFSYYCPSGAARGSGVSVGCLGGVSRALPAQRGGLAAGRGNYRRCRKYFYKE